MRIFTHASQLRKLDTPIMLAVGFFDGVHLGHQKVLLSTVSRARETGGQAWAFTFDRHPLAVLAPSKAPPLLNTKEERLARLEALGLDGVLVLPFTRRLALLPPEAFSKWLCGEPNVAAASLPPELATPAGMPPLRCLRLSEVRCGANWHFGRRAEGTPEMLAQFGAVYGFSVVVVKYAEYQGEEISSTRIREAIIRGGVDDAAAMLGRPYTLSGTITPGRGGGKGLGFPTANILPHAEVLPPFGVYATRTRITGGGGYDSISNFGTSPTFGGGGPTLETHLLNYGEGGAFGLARHSPFPDLYGQHIEVAFLKRIRDEQAFASPADLAEQIQRDIVLARQFNVNDSVGKNK